MRQPSQDILNFEHRYSTLAGRENHLSAISRAIRELLKLYGDAILPDLKSESMLIHAFNTDIVK